MIDDIQKDIEVWLKHNKVKKLDTKYVMGYDRIEPKKIKMDAISVITEKFTKRDK